jgi:methanol metabolism-related c-type cytochrome
MITAKSLLISLWVAGAGATAGQALAQDVAADNITATHDEDGKYFTADGVPTFNVTEDGTVDWYTFSGFRRYHSECHVCHGPDGQGSSYAPALADVTMRLDYYDFVSTVAGGKQVGNNVMPSFGDNRNVMCYIDDIYVYLKAVGSGTIPRGRPAKRAEKPASFTEAENACMG